MSDTYTWLGFSTQIGNPYGKVDDVIGLLAAAAWKEGCSTDCFGVHGF